LSDSAVEKRYVRAGATFRDAVSHLDIGEYINFGRLINKWANWEEEYAHRGYRTVSLDGFVDLRGYGNPIDDVIGQKREQGEEPIFYTQIYRTILRESGADC